MTALSEGIIGTTVGLNAEQAAQVEEYINLLDHDSRLVPDVYRWTNPLPGVALTVPVERYTSREFHDLEVEKVWTKVWAMVDLAVSTYDGLDFAVNAAAIEFEVDYLADLAESDWDRMIDVNLKSIFLCMKHEINAMLATDREGSAIVNIASTNSYRPQPHQSAYTASKFGVLGVTKSAAVDYAPRGIRINAICPGSIDTPMLRGAIEKRGRDPQEVANRLSLIGRFGTVDEIAAAALWLCSGASGFTIGHALAVDGGYLSR